MLPKPKGRYTLEPRRVHGPANFIHTVASVQYNGSFRREHIVNNKLYSKFQLHCRTVGHLSAVYCMLFDQTGR